MKETKSMDTKIEMTDDYGIFTLLVGNRNIDESHVIKLMQKMKVNDLFTPIIVNEKMEVIDGQHRLEARKRLRLIVPYIVAYNYGLEEVQAINAMQKKWTIEDYTDSYIARGLRDYEVYKWFRTRFGLPHHVSVSLLMGTVAHHKGLAEIFNTGNFKVKALEEAKAFALQMEKIAEFFDGYRERGFTLAMLSCMQKEVFDFNKFLRHLKANPRLLKRCATLAQYIEAIEDVYNFRSANKVSLKYGE